jgi:putative Ca2+/H+ antiporter (TMEM165/GDT1 family)
VGLFTFFAKEDDKCDVQLKSPFFSAFSIVLLSELGDKTQVASGVFATQYNPWLVFIGVIFALAILSTVAIFCGSIVLKKVNKNAVRYISSSLFFIIGAFVLMQAIFY